MTPTFIADRADRVGQILPVAGGPDAVPHDARLSAAADTFASRPGYMRRAMAALFSPLRKRRRLLPPQDDYLRRDVGLHERENPREYWEYWWHHS